MAVCTTCPVCKRSIHDNADLWRRMQLLARTAVQPPEFEGWRADILCNDCLRTTRVPYNIVGLRCEGCGSYNTSRLGLFPAPPGTDGAAAEQAPERAAGGAVERGGGEGPAPGGVDPLARQPSQEEGPVPGADGGQQGPAGPGSDAPPSDGHRAPTPGSAL